MDLIDFTKAVSSCKRMKPPSATAARMVLVDGLRVADAARQTGLLRQQIEQAIERIEIAYKASFGLPADWECVTVVVPKERAREIRKIAREELIEAGLAKRSGNE